MIADDTFGSSMVVKISSTVSYIPPPAHVEEENGQPFGVDSPVSFVRPKRKREEEVEEQREDALRRKIVWVSPEHECSGNKSS